MKKIDLIQVRIEYTLHLSKLLHMYNWQLKNMEALWYFKGTVHSKMDLAKLGSFNRSSLKREAQRFFGKIRLPPILWEPFKVLERLLVF